MKTAKLLDRVFPPFSDVAREKPRDMLFIADEKPDMLTTLVAGTQHVLIILMLTVYVVFVGREIGFTGDQLRSFVSIEIVVIGIATLLQSLKTRLSSGHLMIHAPNLMSIAALGAVALNFGIGAAAGAYILAGIFVIVLARFLPRLQKLFPPEVTGILLVLLGLTLVKGGAVAFTGYKDGMIDWIAFLVAGAALGTIVVFSVWASEKIRVFAVVKRLREGGQSRIIYSKAPSNSARRFFNEMSRSGLDIISTSNPINSTLEGITFKEEISLSMIRFCGPIWPSMP